MEQLLTLRSTSALSKVRIENLHYDITEPDLEVSSSSVNRNYSSCLI